MILGADYSWARPGGAALKAAGVAAVGRYLATDGRGITTTEYEDLKAHGVGVWLVREGRASGMLAGYAQGAADARAAEQQIAAVGLPPNTLVYAAADWDVTDAQFPACDNYMRGFASVLGLTRTGLYGGLHYLNHAHTAGLAVSFWQAGATSWNHGETPQMQVAFEQTTAPPPVPGTDQNHIHDLTTTTLEADMPLTQADMNLLLNSAAFDGGPSISTVLLEAHAVYQAATRKVSRQVPGTDGQLVDVEVEQIQDNADTNTMVRALLAKAGLPAPVDVEALATAIVAKLPASTTPSTAADVTAAVTAGLVGRTLKVTS